MNQFMIINYTVLDGLQARNAEEQPTLPTTVEDIEEPYICIKRLQGRDGRDGRDGLPGRDGKDGEQGEQGERGPAGLHGNDGSPGQRGEKGDLGEKGEKGDRGEAGPIGRKGERGVNGIPGLNGVPGPPGPHVAGTTYIRWGRTMCPTGNGTELLYAGRAAGSYFAHRGGGTNLLCLPNSPEYLGNDATNSQSPLYGVEYHTSIGNLNLVDQNVPCAVCYTPTRVAMVMIPAWTHCPASWTEEYIGYIMTEYKNHRRIQHYCVDQNAEVIPGEARDVNGAMLHHVDVACNYGIPCPPYSGTNEVTCAVCTK